MIKKFFFGSRLSLYTCISIGVLALSLSPSRAYAAGSFSYVLSAGFLIDDFQEVSIKDEDSLQPAFEYGGAFLFDWFIQPESSLALGSYALGEEYTLPVDESDDYDRGEQEWRALFVGYRWTTPTNFYIGPGMAFISGEVVLLGGCIEGLCGEVSSESEGAFSNPALALTAGWKYVSSGGFVIGAHLFYSSPTDVDFDELCIGSICINTDTPIITAEDVSLRMIGLSLGYEWE